MASPAQQHHTKQADTVSNVSTLNKSSVLESVLTLSFPATLWTFDRNFWSPKPFWRTCRTWRSCQHDRPTILVIIAYSSASGRHAVCHPGSPGLNSPSVTRPLGHLVRGVFITLYNLRFSLYSYSHIFLAIHLLVGNKLNIYLIKEPVINACISRVQPS